ncbi:unnamed protein product [Rotaria socialis]|uniref:Uncharacterized protein n=1 Tax=Rotaria socialis TaxID=392032 RepID=A0A817MJF9_9BILA|nr:unnamed protein product [Rotaria socialis]CAF3591289.1 unnamed protein product [Rotaria socialis]CAF3660600.1 unnamed protein product [Rotaria socialis]CAF4478201.1 unnamed protein product [Rotaria socialis]CAF4488622.1 unnamed protein product [Rotaria socialis]
MAATTSTSTNDVSSNYHTVSICEDLPTIKKYYSEETFQDLPPADYWVRKMDKKAKQEHYKVQHVMVNGPYTTLIENHPIFAAFLFAYNSHEDIVLSPDDIWLMIRIYFCVYVNENAEKLRPLFVDHNGQKKLIIEQVGMTNIDWDDFLERIQTQLSDNVKNNVTELLRANFSTTTKVELFLSYVATMDTFKKYFEYEACMTLCGIRRAHFMGTLDDWTLLRRKTEQLKNFTTDNWNSFATYINGVLPILDEFIRTYKGDVNNKFWDEVMQINHKAGQSGVRGGDYINGGWILRLFYGLQNSKSHHVTDIKLPSLVVPVQVNNEVTNESKTCHIVGRFHGVQSKGGRHRPVMGFAIIDDLRTITSFKR